MGSLIRTIVCCAIGTTLVFIAAPPVGAFTSCNTDLECRTRPGDFDLCILGQCTFSQCDVDENCAARQKCEVQTTDRSRRCVNVECRGDSDCPVPGSLTAGDAPRFCINYVCKQCRQDNQCLNRSCDEQTNTCITCRSAADCPANLPICTHGRCDNCRVDADCRKPGYCGDDGLCKAGVCRTSADCLAGWDCLAGRCAPQRTDLQRLLAELSKIRRLVVQVPPGLGVPATFDLRELGALINASGAVRSTIGLVILDKSGRPLVNLGQFMPTAGGGVSLSGSFSGKTSSAIPRTGDLCGFSIAVTDESGVIQGRIPVCFEVK